MIKFKQDTTLQVVEGYDEENDNITEEVEETFKKGELVSADIVSDDDNSDDDSDYVDIQFGDGSVAFRIQRDCFEVVESFLKSTFKSTFKKSQNNP